MSNMTRIGSLFSGAGGLDLAVESVFGGHTVWHCEQDASASKVLAAHWPDVPNFGDITTVDWSTVEPVDVLCGGFPCQDVSAAGRRAGIADGTRSGLWSYFAEAIDVLRPPLVVIENVRGLLSAKAIRASAMESDDAAVGDGQPGPVLRAAGAVLGDLADLGYDAVWATVAAASVGAPHRRERVFIVAHPAERGPQGFDGGSVGAPSRSGRGGVAAGSDGRATSPVDLLPTPHANDDWRGGMSNQVGIADIPRLLPTPATADADRGPDFARASRDGSGGDDLVTICARATRQRGSNWGKYGPAIHHWGQLTRTAPSPTEPNTKGNPRLAAPFSEWMMGWPQGWATNVAGISRNDALRIIGNGVVPQQAAAAITHLLQVAASTNERIGDNQ